MIKRGYNSFGKKNHFYDMKKRVQHFNVKVFSGYHLDCVKSGEQLYLRIDTVKTGVCSQTALEMLDVYYKACQGNKTDKRKYVKEVMIGKYVMTNYGKNRFFQITDIIFNQFEEYRLEDDRSFSVYYE